MENLAEKVGSQVCRIRSSLLAFDSLFPARDRSTIAQVFPALTFPANFLGGVYALASAPPRNFTTSEPSLIYFSAGLRVGRDIARFRNDQLCRLETSQVGALGGARSELLANFSITAFELQLHDANMSSFLRPTKKSQLQGPSKVLQRPNPIRTINQREQSRRAAAAAASTSSSNRAAGDPSLASVNQLQCPNKSCKEPNVVDGICRTCGRVADDSNIVAEVQFAETSSGAAVVQGSYLGADQGGVRSLGPGFRRLGGEDREKSIRESRVMMQGFAHQLNINETIVNAGVQIFKLASMANFIQGRRMTIVAAVCLYAACRKEKPCKVMLIDFADLVQVNVFKLGHAFKALHKAVIITRNGMLPVFPEDLIYRFAARLEFGHFTTKVAETAVRLVQRMSQDWMVMGRRPSGICGACLIMAARMYNFRRTVREVVYIVKVTTHTIQRRLDEFKFTESSEMTVEDFLTQDFLESAHDPPSFYQKSEEYQRLRHQKSRKRKRAAEDDGEDADADAEVGASREAPGPSNDAQSPTNPGIATPPDMSALPQIEYRRDDDGFIIPPLPPKDQPIDPNLADPDAPEALDALAAEHGENGVAPSVETPPTAGPGRGRRRPPLLNIDEEWEEDEDDLEQQISEIIGDPHSHEHARAFSTAEQRARVHAMWALSLQPQRVVSMEEIVRDDEFNGDPEVENCMLTPEESKLKELLWVNENKDWLRGQQEAMFRRKIQAAGPPKQTRRRRKRARMGEGQTSPASTPYEAALSTIKDRGFSKRINYDAIRELFEFGGRGPGSVIGSEITSRRTSRAGSAVVDDTDDENGGASSSGPRSRAAESAGQGEEEEGEEDEGEGYPFEDDEDGGSEGDGEVGAVDDE